MRGQKDFNNPPIAVDDTGTAKQGETSILVDALANDRDLDGDRASLTITKFLGDGVSAEGKKLRIQLRPQARVVPYFIEDADGAVAMALIYVPAGSNGLPYAVDGKTIKMGADSTVKVALGDYVSDPRGGKVARHLARHRLDLAGREPPVRGDLRHRPHPHLHGRLRRSGGRSCSR